MRGIAIPDIDVVAGKVVQTRRRSKYGNQRTKVGDLTFDSAKEARRWGELKLLERAGEISELTRQQPFPMKFNGALLTTYVADFVYRDKSGAVVVEDSKGVQTRDFRTKRKMLKQFYGLDVVLS